MKYRKLSNIEKWYLKYTDRPKYLAYKRMLRDYDFFHHTLSIKHPCLDHPYKAVTTFKHSGNSGDIIYALPTVFELSKNGTAHLYLQVGQRGEYGYYHHPLGNVMLTEKMVELLKPLLLYQPKIKKVEIYYSSAVDYDLDEFRKYSFKLDRGNIIRWYFNVYGVSYDTSQPWLIAPKDAQYANNIVISRSHRYRSPLIDYRFLKKYPDKLFIGVKEEYNEMKKVLPDLQYKPVSDFLEMATVINSCKLFIGNQSFPFSLAEGLKTTRLLEVYYKIPNVIVEGKGANDFMYQPQFEYSVKRLLES
ncbi:MAG TPA: hypothetical protein VGN63_13435 [Flavisolibacter sp.]|nr:hypothetical protein [Flavisolibacter sp.]